MEDPSTQLGRLDSATADASLCDVEPPALDRGGMKLGPFLLLEKCGQGAMGVVYAARDLRDGLPVAIKVLPAAFLTDLGRARRFAAEAEVLASLQHAAIVRHLEHGTTPRGELFLAMEWLEGEDLSRTLERRELRVCEAAALGQRIAEGLAAAHAQGVVHRDIKPSNLFLRGGAAEQVVILDFGIARNEQAPFSLTASGTVIGTPGYMAPEQARGAREIDARADLFSLGAVLFECLARRPAFAGEHVMAVLAKVLLEDPPRLVTLRPDVPPALDALVARLLAKDPAARPPSASTVAAELARMSLEGGDMEAAPARSRAGMASSITDSEQRFLCVILAGAARAASEKIETSPAQASAATRPVPSSEGLLVTLEVIAAPLGAKVVRLLDGSVLATLQRNGNAADQAVRAARCALALHALLPEVPLAIATGLGDARAAVPVGQVLDRAAGLVRAGGRNDGSGIWVDEVTAGLLDARFVVRAGPRGHELVEERGAGAGARLLLGRPSPCVGRERQLRSLGELLDECVAEGVARAVLIKAPAGAGKSRLLHEFLATASRRDDVVAVWIGRGDPFSAGSAFALLASALRHATGVREGEAVEVRRHKLAARVARHVVEKDRVRVAAFLGELVATPFPADELPLLRSARANPIVLSEQVRRAVEDFVAAECGAGPVLLALEDLHWGDLPSVKLLDGVLDRLRDRPLLIAAAGRPEVDDLFPRLWAERDMQELRLGGLTRRAAEQLVCHALGEGNSADTMLRIVERAEGNAFYLEELIRAVAEGRGEALPETVLAMVQARLDALDADDRRILRAASVFGETFCKGGVLTLLGATKWTESIGARLDALVAREVFVRSERSQFPSELEFAFRHGLLRDGAYATLTDHDRTVGHRLAGAWLAEQGESDPLVLAEHFERSGEPAKAEVHYLRAAQQAFLGNDLSAALARADRGIACVTDGQHRLDLFEVHARTLYSLGELASAAARMEELLRLAPRWSRTFCAALAGKLLVAKFHGRPEAIVEVMGEFSDVAPSAENAVSLLQLCWILQVVLILSESLDLAQRYFELAEQAYREASSQDFAAQGYIAAIRAERARFVEANPWKGLTFLQRAMAHFEEAGEQTYSGLACSYTGEIYTQLGAYDRAEAAIRRASQIMPGTEGGTPRAVLVFTLADRGALEEAVAQAEATVAEAQRSPGGESMAWTMLAYALRLRGDLDGAARWAVAALELPPMYPRHRAMTLAMLASVRLSQGRVAEALAAAREAMGHEEPPRLLADHEPLIRLVHVEVLHAAGDPEGASKALAIARARLLATAAKLGDPALRRSFLEDVANNARTLRLAEERLGPASAEDQ